jgi:hypothetical protein
MFGEFYWLLVRLPSWLPVGKTYRPLLACVLVCLCVALSSANRYLHHMLLFTHRLHKFLVLLTDGCAAVALHHGISDYGLGPDASLPCFLVCVLTSVALFATRAFNLSSPTATGSSTSRDAFAAAAGRAPALRG